MLVLKTLVITFVGATANANIDLRSGEAERLRLSNGQTVVVSCEKYAQSYPDRFGRRSKTVNFFEARDCKYFKDAVELTGDLETDQFTCSSISRAPQIRSYEVNGTCINDNYGYLLLKNVCMKAAEFLHKTNSGRRN